MVPPKYTIYVHIPIPAFVLPCDYDNVSLDWFTTFYMDSLHESSHVMYHLNADVIQPGFVSEYFSDVIHIACINLTVC